MTYYPSFNTGRLLALSLRIALVTSLIPLLTSPTRAEDLTWVAASSGNWNTTTANWSGLRTTFVQGDNVFFTDSGLTPNPSIALSGVDTAFTVGTMDVSHLAGTYTINTSGKTLSGTNLVKTGGGLLVLNATNTAGLAFTNVNLSGGEVNVRQNSFTATNLNILGNVTISGATTFGNVNLQGTTMTGSAVLTITPPAGANAATQQFTLSPDTSTFTGTITNGGNGYINLSAAASNLGAAKVNLTGAVNLQGASATTLRIGELTGASGTSIAKSATVNNLTLEIGALNTASNFAGVIKNFGVQTNGNAISSGNVALTKVGSSTLTLTNANTYTGATQVNAGVLILGADGLIAGTSSITIMGGAELDLSAKTSGYSLGTPMTLEVGAANAGFVDAGVNVLTLDGALTLNFASSTLSGSYNLLDFSASLGDFDSISYTGAYAGSLVKSGELWNGTAGAYSLSFSEIDGVLTVVPEPTGLTLLVGALALVSLRRRRSAA